MSIKIQNTAVSVKNTSETGDAEQLIHNTQSLFSFPMREEGGGSASSRGTDHPRVGRSVGRGSVIGDGGTAGGGRP